MTGARRHRRVFPRRGQIPCRRPPQMRGAVHRPKRPPRTRVSARCAASRSRSASCRASKSLPTGRPGKGRRDSKPYQEPGPAPRDHRRIARHRLGKQSALLSPIRPLIAEIGNEFAVLLDAHVADNRRSCRRSRGRRHTPHAHGRGNHCRRL